MGLWYFSKRYGHYGERKVTFFWFFKSFPQCPDKLGRSVRLACRKITEKHLTPRPTPYNPLILGPFSRQSAWWEVWLRGLMRRVRRCSAIQPGDRKCIKWPAPGVPGKPNPHELPWALTGGLLLCTEMTLPCVLFSYSSETFFKC